MITVATVILQIVKAITALSKLSGPIGTFFGGINVNALKTVAIILGVVAALIALAAIIAVIIGKSHEMNNSLSNIGSTVNQVKSSAMDQGTTAANGMRQKSISSLPHYATGTDYHPGGRAVVGENGPEVVDLPRGSKVYPNGTVGGDVYYVTIDAKNVKEFNDITRLAKKQQQMIVKG
jgi:hypothetical protein